MKLSEKLLILANWLEDTENDILVNAEHDDACLSVVAGALVKAAGALKEGAEQVSKVEPAELTSEKLEELAAVAQSFDESGDEFLMKQASVLDELLLTLAAPRNSVRDFQVAENNRLEELKKKYKDVKTDLDDMNKVSDTLDKIQKSPYYKQYRPLEAPLSQRCCPDHPGVMIARVGEHIWQCLLDKKVYNYETGFKTLKDNKVPGGGVEYQIPASHDVGHAVFDTRESRLGTGTGPGSFNENK